MQIIYVSSTKVGHWEAQIILCLLNLFDTELLSNLQITIYSIITCVYVYRRPSIRSAIRFVCACTSSALALAINLQNHRSRRYPNHKSVVSHCFEFIKCYPLKYAQLTLRSHTRCLACMYTLGLHLSCVIKYLLAFQICT